MNIPVRIRTLSWLYFRHLTPGKRSYALPHDAWQYLRPANPFLLDLKSRYAEVRHPPHSCWKSWEEAIPLRQFRAESIYLSQGYFKNSQERYRITTAYIEVLDDCGLLRSLTEDSLFGIKLWDVGNGLIVSRDLLDSILEILWLKKVLGWSKMEAARILDIGAGYGRFAHRFTSAFENGKIACVDAVATSTFLCDFYLRFRRSSRTTVVPLDRLDEIVAGTIDLAVNIHSWSESSVEWVRFWLDFLVDLRVPYLFLVPNFSTFRTKESDGSFNDFGEELRRHGYKAITKERKFWRSEICDHFGAFPYDYYLFQRC